MSLKLKDSANILAARATKLNTARTINGVSFDGTSNITITANPNSHTHDDRYYTESEVNTKIDSLRNDVTYISSLRDFTTGALIKTSLNYSNGTPWLLEITGNAYGDGIPFSFKAQGYCFNDGLINYGAISNGAPIGSINVFSYEGKICFYIPRSSYWQGYSVRFTNVAGSSRCPNLVSSITNVAKPTGITKDFSITIRQSFHEGHKPTWAEVDGKPTSFTPATHTHDDRYFTESEINTKLTSQQTSLTSGKNYIHDTRGANRAPNYYARRETRFDFVESTHLGCGGDSWTTLLTASPWSSYSDTHRQQQLAFKGSGGLSFRYATSDTAWSGWQTIYSTINKPTWNDIQSKPSSFTPATHTHTYDTFGISNTDAGNKKGISLYGGATSGQPSYGLMFSGTSGSGNNGGVTGDWATYFTMTGADTRGWIFKHSSTNVASVDGTGRLFAKQGFFTRDMNCGLVPGNGDGSNNLIANIKLQSWYGIGFSPSSSGQTIPAGENAVYINCRSGDLTARGDLIAHRYSRLHAYPGYGSGSANMWYHGTAKLLAIENVDGIQLANSRNVLNDQDGRLYLNNGGGNANDMKGWKSARFGNSTANRPYDWSSCISFGGGMMNDTVQIAWSSGTSTQLAVRSTHDTSGAWNVWQRYSPATYGTGGPNNSDGYEDGAIYYQY